MFKRIILALIILNCTLTYAQKADLEVVYYFKYNSDSLNKSNFIQTNMTLLCNKNKSIYFNPAMVEYFKYLDQQSKTMDVNNIKVDNITPIPTIRHNVWKENNTITATIPLGMYSYSFKEPVLEWELLDESKDIQGMHCKLAKTNTENDTFYAWYAPEIPISDGPFRFKGLPGLIVEAHNKGNTIQFLVASIKKSDKEIEKMERALTTDLLDKKDFFKAREKWLKHPFNSNLSKERQKQILDNVRKINVFLD